MGIIYDFLYTQVVLGKAEDDKITAFARLLVDFQHGFGKFLGNSLVIQTALCGAEADPTDSSSYRHRPNPTNRFRKTSNHCTEFIKLNTNYCQMYLGFFIF